MKISRVEPVILDRPVRHGQARRHAGRVPLLVRTDESIVGMGEADASP
jgi:L-alanine-DL-glutamate epimerase-like enolase superfamily enzyme